MAEMGDPTEVERSWTWPTGPDQLDPLIAVLAVLGLGIAAMTLCLDGEYLLRRQLVAMGVGLAAMAALWGADHSFFLRRLWLWARPCWPSACSHCAFPCGGGQSPWRLSVSGTGDILCPLVSPLCFIPPWCATCGPGQAHGGAGLPC